MSLVKIYVLDATAPAFLGAIYSLKFRLNYDVGRAFRTFYCYYEDNAVVIFTDFYGEGVSEFESSLIVCADPDLSAATAPLFNAI